MKTKSLQLLLAGCFAISLTGCHTGNATNQNGQLATTKTDLTHKRSATPYIKAAYIDVSASGAVAQIPTSAYSAPNIIIFGFADVNASTMSPAYSAAINKAMSYETDGTVNLLSIGGENVKTITITDTDQLINNIVTQINLFNNSSYASNGKQIDGVDLDLENKISSDVIAKLANAFKSHGLIVSIAPQIIGSGNISSLNSESLSLTSGGNFNTYQEALNSGTVDYIFVQTYNSGGFTIDGSGEDDVHFIMKAAKALNNTVSNSTCNGASLCIPKDTKIVVGTLANRYGTPNENNIYNPFSKNTSAADQSETLKALQSDIESMQNDTAYSNIKGIMVWSMNKDYAANLYDPSNTAYTTGAFNSTIFGANPSPAGKQLQIEFSNYGSTAVNITLVPASGNYFVFGSDTQASPFSTNQSAQWCSSDIASVSCPDSWNLDNSEISVGKAYKIYVTPVGKQAVKCTSGTGVNGGTFKAGYQHIMVNYNSASNVSCEIG